MNNDAAEKIAMIQGSLRCFIFGVASLLPGVGLPCAVLSLWYAGRVRVREKKYWNAAKPYRVVGVLITFGGLVLWLLAVAVIIYNSIPDGGGRGDWSGLRGD
jgi:hypothetical protein